MGVRVSCVIPAWNAERYIAATIESVRSQTVAVDELIVVDDGSTDGTRGVVESIGGVTYVHQTNAGHGAARNRGVEVSTGDFVTFLDADDLWEPDKTERQLASFERRVDLDVSLTHVVNFWSEQLEVTEEMRAKNVVGRPIPGWSFGSMMARRTVFERAGMFDSELKHGPDTDWILRAKDAGIVMEMMSDVLVRRRLHGENLSVIKATSSRAEYLRIVKASLDRRRSG